MKQFADEALALAAVIDLEAVADGLEAALGMAEVMTPYRPARSTGPASDYADDHDKLAAHVAQLRGLASKHGVKLSAPRAPGMAPGSSAGAVGGSLNDQPTGAGAVPSMSQICRAVNEGKLSVADGKAAVAKLPKPQVEKLKKLAW